LIGTEAPFAPYTFVDAVGAITGFERDIGDEVCKRALLNCTWENVIFDQLLPGVAAGRFDIVLGGIAVTPERMKLVDFSQTYNDSTDRDWFYGRDGAPMPDEARIGVQSGTLQAAYARDQGYNVYPFATEPKVLQALTAGNIDLAFGTFSADTLDKLQAEAGINALYSADVPDMGTAMAVCRGNTALLTQINAALQAMQADGTIDKITDRWM
jgi:ABC-type amino acid transport substrate-binding protein